MMEDDVAIKVEHVSKKYCKSLKRSMIYGIGDIGRNMLGIKAGSERLRQDEFWAVDDISFEVKKGESIGIIGSNGSGKSTTLKMLNGIFWPDKGRITIKGKVGALIEVGAGFHPMLTGRENIYVNAAVLGMPKKEIDEKFDDIVEFADIGNFLDMPVKNYSSGMYVRLGFAIAVFSVPDVLLIDEVLAVGDKNFQMKCYQKIHEIKKMGTTIIFVAHNEYTIREQTQKCLYLKNGIMEYYGLTEDAINLYIKDTLDKNLEKNESTEHVSTPDNKKAQILSLKFLDSDNNEISYIETGKEIRIILTCRFNEKISEPIFGVNFYDTKGFMYCANSDYDNIKFGEHCQGISKVIVKIPNLYLPTNTYRCSVIIADENVGNLIDWHDMKYNLVVGRATNARGLLKLPTEWEIQDEVPTNNCIPQQILH